ncbi:metallophosphoesterase [Hydrogenoanaerobacterium sp.]|uniref:metallophosphoesterase n=1 Tax=Hydrogenoanaerobacterium sp. TaxID=2953763 RepID=UPI00289F4B06|nr:metallophosphoesterase [Hydrogenoanaerobacterium sp.]
MFAYKRISQTFRSSHQIPFDDSSKIIIMSDCHRGDGSWADNFAKNQNLFFAALDYYNQQKYTYIELGDGDELWENKKLSDIIEIHGNAFWIMSRFYRDNRLHLLFGNHDMVKKNFRLVENDYNNYYDARQKKYTPLFPGIKIHEGIILRHTSTGKKIFLLHGHQADFLNDTLWRLSRFLVRYFWKPLESVGVKDPTSAAKNYKRKKQVEKKLTKWSVKEEQMLIAGHTHRPVLPDLGEPLYFNDGSCVHPRCITGIEIVRGEILLVKWSYKTKSDGTVYVGRQVLAGPNRLEDYFRPAEDGELYRYLGSANTAMPTESKHIFCKR